MSSAFSLIEYLARVLCTDIIACLVKSSEAGLAMVTGVAPVSASSTPYIEDISGTGAILDLDCSGSASASVA